MDGGFVHSPYFCEAYVGQDLLASRPEDVNYLVISDTFTVDSQFGLLGKEIEATTHLWVYESNSNRISRYVTGDTIRIRLVIRLGQNLLSGNAHTAYRPIVYKIAVLHKRGNISSVLAKQPRPLHGRSSRQKGPVPQFRTSS